MTGMRLIAELEPTRNHDKLLKMVSVLVEYYNAIDIPEAPMGRPLASAAVLASYIKCRWDVDVIPHLRIVDVNKTSLISIIGGLKAVGVRETVLLKGDKPWEGVIVGDVATVEEAAAYVKARVSKPPLLGAMLSLRYGFSDIASRLTSPLDFFLVLRPTHDLQKLRDVSRRAKSLGKRLYAYIITALDKDGKARLQSMLGDQPVYLVDEALSVIELLKDSVDGVIVSSPGSVDAIRALGEKMLRTV